MDNDNLSKYLQPTYFIDSDAPALARMAEDVAGKAESQKEKAIALYLAVRDGFYYNPYAIDCRPESLKASAVLNKKSSYCVEKANLLAALCRAAGLPARLGFAIVKNHIGTSRLEVLLQTDRLVFHGYTEIWLEGKWVKATPAFNKGLCDKMGVPPLEFDGQSDSVFQAFAPGGQLYMEYLHDYGNFDDLPRTLYISELRKHYPHIFETDYSDPKGEFFRFLKK